MSVDTPEGLAAIRIELDKIEDAIAMRAKIDASSEPVAVELTKAEAVTIIEGRVAVSKGVLKGLGFTGPVTRVS